jgi:hypothetical protein
MGRCCETKINVARIKVMKISRQPSSVEIKVDQKSRRMWNISTILVTR